ncbi:Hypothetical Protein FCC1311_078272 [Hondaea fermentalgiana]|uniref:Uncharacterized protein n=1 Tax=Hondaea fermentalgiana TaxID=2315210 RepID=A0A2R5GL20_9STRA|nr:Hypothetical Protein FCC1311_078272 [Hondaea fermentalgiana]|eukprot:GBG31602.1 Hypothetical Protein FCC1311_078272 [Hondaea fermentalgiana]
MEKLPRYLQTHCLSYLGCQDAARAMGTSKDMLFLLTGLEQQATSLVVESARDSAKDIEEDSAKETLPRQEDSAKKAHFADQVLDKAMSRLTARPQFAVVFYKDTSCRQRIASFAEHKLPRGVPVLAAQVQDVQSCAGGDEIPNTESNMVVEMGAFPGAVCVGFALDGSTTQSGVLPAGHEATFWKVFVILACGSASHTRVPSLIEELHGAYPAATVIGGISGTVSLFEGNASSHTFLRNGYAVLAFGGNVPLRACVSLGLEPISPLVTVETATWASDSEMDVVMVRQGDSVVAATHWLSHASEGTIGIKFSGQSGFQLVEDASFTVGMDGVPRLRVMLENAPANANPEGATMGTFVATTRAAVSDLHKMLDRLKAHLAQNDERVLAGLMFSCSARGPHPMTKETGPMLDARAFQDKFGVPLIGFYAGGEIGPRARALVDGEAFESSRAVVQGYTVVYGVFIVPHNSFSPLELYGNVTAEHTARIRDFLAGKRPLYDQ